MGWVYPALGVLVVLLAVIAARPVWRRWIPKKVKAGIEQQITAYRTATLVLAYAFLILPIWATLAYYVLDAFLEVARDDTVLAGVDLRWHVLALVGLITAFGALVSAPLALVRIIISERQTKTAEARRDYDDRTLVNQRIQGALQQLGARYNRTRMGRTVTHGAETKRVSVLDWEDAPGNLPEKMTNAEFTDWAPVVFSEPDTQARLAAIGEMQAIVTEHPEKRRAINEHLANYIRANAPIEAPDPETPEDKPRIAPDIQAAIALIGKSSTREETQNLDLRATNLAEAELVGAFLEGANLFRAWLEGAKLGGARLEGADLSVVRLKGADLGGARLEGAKLRFAHLEGAALRAARLEGAKLGRAYLEGADLVGAQLDAKTNFTGAVVRYAAVESTNLDNVELTQEQINSMFGDASVTPPKGLNPPAHWPEWDLGDKFWVQCQKWRDDPDNYTPPPKPRD